MTKCLLANYTKKTLFLPIKTNFNILYLQVHIIASAGDFLKVYLENDISKIRYYETLGGH